MKKAYVFVKNEFDQFRKLEKVLFHLEVLKKACSGNEKFLDEDTCILASIIDDMVKNAEGRVEKRH